MLACVDFHTQLSSKPWWSAFSFSLGLIPVPISPWPQLSLSYSIQIPSSLLTERSTPEQEVAGGSLLLICLSTPLGHAQPPSILSQLVLTLCPPFPPPRTLAQFSTLSLTRTTDCLSIPWPSPPLTQTRFSSHISQTYDTHLVMEQMPHPHPHLQPLVIFSPLSRKFPNSG